MPGTPEAQGAWDVYTSESDAIEALEELCGFGGALTQLEAGNEFDAEPGWYVSCHQGGFLALDLRMAAGALLDLLFPDDWVGPGL